MDVDLITTLVTSNQSLRIELQQKDSEILNLVKKNHEQQVQLEELQKQNAHLITQMSDLQATVAELKRTVAELKRTVASLLGNE